MTNDGPEPVSKAVAQAAQAQKEPSPRMCRVINTDMNRPQPSNPPETPTPPPSSTNRTRAREPVTLPERHQTALRHIHTLEAHNAKLYEDNCRLVNAVNTLNDRLVFFGAPQNAQVLRLADMQEKLRASETSRASINRKYQELLQCVSAGSTQHHIILELQAVRDAYASLDREYHILGDKYVRLKALANTSRATVAQQQSPGTAPAPYVARDPIPVVRSEFRVHHDHSQNNSASPTSGLSPVCFQRFPEREHRRRSSESVLAQPSLRLGTTPIATTWLTPLPTPPPSAPLPGGQISPTSFPVHAPVPTGSFAFPHHVQMNHDPRAMSGLSTVTLPRSLVEQGALEQRKTDIRLHQCSSEVADTNDDKQIPFGEQIPVPASMDPSPRPPKRLNTELQISMSPAEERKKPRVEGETDRQTTTNPDTYPTSKIRSPSASTGLHNDCKSSVSDSDARSYEDCVNLIFEKDANVEHGVFCSLCLDRYEAKMIPEPPDVLVQPDFDFLLSHSMTMHPTVWDDLRRKA